MKGFWTVLVVLTVLCLLLVIHTIYIGNITQDLVNYANALPESVDAFEAARAYNSEAPHILYENWDHAIRILSFSIPYAQIDRADEAIAELIAAWNARDSANYLAAREKTKDTLQRIHMLQGVHWQGIL